MLKHFHFLGGSPVFPIMKGYPSSWYSGLRREAEHEEGKRALLRDPWIEGLIMVSYVSFTGF